MMTIQRKESLTIKGIGSSVALRLSGILGACMGVKALHDNGFIH